MSDHDTAVADLGEGTGRYQARCGCGWSGRPHPWAEQARNDATAHTNLQALKSDMRAASEGHRSMAPERRRAGAL